MRIAGTDSDAAATHGYPVLPNLPEGVSVSALRHSQGHGLTRMGTELSVGVTERALRHCHSAAYWALLPGRGRVVKTSSHSVGWVVEL